MTVLVVEDNLLWSERLKKSLLSLGHEALVVAPSAADRPGCDVAIVNLSQSSAGEEVRRLKSMGAWVIGHAGHKERDLISAGKEYGCDRVASNSELTYKLEKLLAEAKPQVS